MSGFGSFVAEQNVGVVKDYCAFCDGSILLEALTNCLNARQLLYQEPNLWCSERWRLFRATQKGYIMAWL